MLKPLTSDDPGNIGPYRLRGRLGSGSSGTVYAAQRHSAQDQTKAGDLAAVKVPKSENYDMTEFYARFSGEIDAISLVKSEFVPGFIDSAVDAGSVWMAVELIPGLSLHDIISPSAALGEEAVWYLGAGLVDALIAIHAVGIVHRDLRPKNVLLTVNGPWVIDFSLAYRVGLADRGPAMKARTVEEYMSPEERRHGPQAAGMPADVFGLAATLVFAATKHSPLEYVPPQDAQQGRYNLDGLEGDLRTLIQQCLHMQPERRPSLESLRIRFAQRTSPAGRDGFTAALPGRVVHRLGAFDQELARKMSVSGPERLGWGVAQRARIGTKDGAARPGSRPGRQATTADGPPPRSAAPPPRWTSQSLRSWTSGPIAVRDGRIVLARLDGRVIVLDAADGKPPAAWSEPVDLGAALHAGALLYVSGDGRACAYLGAADGRVYAIDLATRRVGILLEATAAIEGTPVVAGHRICALSADGQVHSADPVTGERKVLAKLGTAATGALSATTSTLFASGADGTVFAIDANTGRLNWRFSTAGLVFADPIPRGDQVYVCGTDGLLRKISIENGEQQGKRDIGAAVHVTPARNGNRLYVASSDGVVHRYDISLGTPTEMKELWPHPLGDEIAGLAVYGDHVYVAAGRRLVDLEEVNSNRRHESLILSMDSLIGGGPVIRGEHCYVADLSGVVACFSLGQS